MKKLIIFSTVFVTACQISPDTKKTEQLSSLNILAQVDINNIFQDGNNQHQVDGKNVLYKLDHGCQLDRIFNYPNNQSVTYRYIFKNGKLISATTIMPDDRNTEKMQSVWNDVESESIKENFEQATEYFSKNILHQCH